MIDLTPFFTLRRHLEIAHHIPGRVRMRVGAEVFSELGHIDTVVFDRILGAIEGIKDVRVNPMARSVVISYAADTIKPAWWDTLVHGEESKAEDLLQQLLETNLAPALRFAQDQ